MESRLEELDRVEKEIDGRIEKWITTNLCNTRVYELKGLIAEKSAIAVEKYEIKKLYKHH